MLAATMFYGVIISVLLSFLHAYIGYKRDLRLMDSNLKTAGRLCLAAIDVASDPLDVSRLKSIFQSILGQSGMASLEIKGKRENQDISFKLGSANSPGMLEKTFLLESASALKGLSGTLILRADPDRLKHRERAEWMEYFLFMMLLVGTFSIILFVLIRKGITQNLLSIAEYTSTLKFDESDLPLKLDGKKNARFLADEFDSLELAMHTMHKRVMDDLRQRKESEEKRVRERALLIALIDSIPDLISYKDIDSVYLGCNKAFEEFCGWKMQDLIGRMDLDLFPRHLAEFFRAQDREMFAAGGPRSNEEWVTYPDGRKVLLDTLKTVYKDEKGEVLGLIGISRDITARKMVENELTAARELLEKTFNATPVMTMILDGQSEKLIDVNLCCLQKTGYSKEELIDLKICEIGILYGDDVQNRFYRLLEKDDAIDELQVGIRKKSGENINCLLASRKVTFAGRPCLLIFLEDITLRRQAEKAMLRSMKMDAVGQVIGGISHDFNNILGVIVGNLDFVRRFGSLDEQILKRVEAAARATDRGAMLTRQLLDFSRQQTRECIPVDINNIIKGMKSLLAKSVTPEVELVLNLSSNLWIVDIDCGDFENVLLNLVINSRDAMPEGGKLYISTANTVLDEYQTLMNPGLEPGEYALLSVRDDGVGIPSEVLEHVFEPFYTTKPQGKGTGLGLSMVYAFSQRSKGYVRLYSEVGVGTTVHVYLPRTMKEPDKIEGFRRLMPGLPGGNETILLVDDEVDILILADDVLKILGYTTLTCQNGNEAVQLLLSKGDMIDMLFTDVVMPGGINGFELAKQALMLYPNLKILFTTGCVEKAVPKTGELSFSPQILFKPYDELDLAIRIREVLDGQE
jgi:PAS domain S-box-containing protein